MSLRHQAVQAKRKELKEIVIKVDIYRAVNEQILIKYRDYLFL